MGLGGLIKGLFKKAPADKISIFYIPDKGIELDDKTIYWGMDRGIIREHLKNSHTEDNTLHDLSEFFAGDTSNNITQNKDIYTNVNGGENYFSLSYNSESKLSEIEVHSGAVIQINETSFTFGEEILECIAKIGFHGYAYNEVDEGEYFFGELKMLVASDESMGGDTSGLGYFYCAKDVTHIAEELPED